MAVLKRQNKNKKLWKNPIKKGKFSSVLQIHNIARYLNYSDINSGKQKKNIYLYSTNLLKNNTKGGLKKRNILWVKLVNIIHMGIMFRIRYVPK